MKAYPAGFLYILVAAGLSGCGSESDDVKDVSGPCIHYYQEPVVNIDEVVGLPAGTGLASVKISELTVNGHDAHVFTYCFGSGANQTELIPSSTCVGLTREENTLICHLPCGFGSQSGEWKFTLSADGYESVQKNVTADYQEFRGGCPSYNDKGSRLEFTLNEQEL